MRKIAPKKARLAPGFEFCLAPEKQEARRRAGLFTKNEVLAAAYEFRRSAVQVPEQSPEPATQWPEPSVEDSLPWPLALLTPRATFTVTAPVSPTVPDTVNEALPA